MIHRTDDARWRELESNAHLPEVQELIRQEIQNGTIRVRPKRGVEFASCRLVCLKGKNRWKWISRPPHRKTRRAHPGEWLSGVASHATNTSSMPMRLSASAPGRSPFRDVPT